MLCLQCFNQRPRRLITAEVRLLALACLALEKQLNNTYAIRPRVLGFYEERGGDSPQRSPPVEKYVLMCNPTLANVNKLKLYFPKTYRR